MSLRFFYNNLFDTATVTSSSDATGFEVARIQHRLFLKTWRSTGITAEWVKWNLGAATDIKAVIIRYSNLQVGDSLAIQRNATNSSDFTTPTESITVTITADMVTRGVIPVNWTTAKSGWWWRVLMTAAAGTYIRIGRIFCGSYNEAERNYDRDGYSVETVDPSDITISERNQKHVNPIDSYRVVSMKFSSFKSTDKTLYDSMALAVGKSKTFFVITDSADLPNTCIYCTCSSGWKIDHVFSLTTWAMEITLEEES